MSTEPHGRIYTTSRDATPAAGRFGQPGPCDERDCKGDRESRTRWARPL